jgi:hypothetical protein
MTKKLADTFRSWAPKLTIAEANALMVRGVTHQEIQRLRARIRNADTPVIRMALVEIRAQRKGFWGQCESCKGEGFIPNPNPAVVTLYEGVNLFREWEPTEPPFGPGWQLWDEAEGSPDSPVFKTPEALAQWCFKKWKSPELKEWEKWVKSFRDQAPPKPRPHFRIQSDHFKVYLPSQTPKYIS